MDSEMTTYLIIGLILGIIIGIIFANVFSSKSREYNKVKQELEEANQAIATQKQMMVKHFSQSADVFDNMAKEFRRLYQHTTENSPHLITPEDLETLDITPKVMLSDVTTKRTEPMHQAPPKDYSGNPSGLLKGEDTKVV